MQIIIVPESQREEKQCNRSRIHQYSHSCAGYTESNNSFHQKSVYDLAYMLLQLFFFSLKCLFCMWSFFPWFQGCNTFLPTELQSLS